MDELKSLRKGRGLDTPDLATRVGPELRAVFSLPEKADSAQVRTRLTKGLAELAARLPADLAFAAAAALALSEDKRTQFYGKRVDLVAGHFQRDRRTATRHIDKSLRVLAELAIADAAGATPDARLPVAPWQTTELRTWVVLDREAPEIYEMRRVTTTEKELRELRLEVSVPVPSDWKTGSAVNDPEIVVLSGGTLRTRLNYSSTRVVFDLEPAEPLIGLREHEFFIRYRFSGARKMGPFYTCTPSFPCRSFDLHIRFDEDQPPPSIWKVDGLRMSEVEDDAAPREPVGADSAGEVNVQFLGLTPNLSYGVVWQQRTRRPR
ncbi:hypothetical protein [Amycolatopsis magusensis]|uniref:hypothetical protein n=1 Tax=Amycolatopsis magusensis TaxID=882444 RepID=UPI0024A8C480|nr:hypothetical protein [Amycolatopsis magusensis]MDI5976734.1 hypothetical protein [Amycolatopsis magusensis]